jgi:DNA-binding transcriptional MerR regulator
MARLRISEAANVTGVSRVTLHRYIKTGRLSRNPDGTIDTAELQRIGLPLKHTPEVTEKPQVTLPETDRYLERYIATLESERESLTRQLEHALERETFLLRLLEQAQLQSQRLLDRPQPVTVPGPQRRSPVLPESWQRILDYMGQQHGSVTAGQVKEALGLQTEVRHTLNRMVLKGLLQRVEPGVYRLD